MNENVIASRYARGLAECARERDEIALAREDLNGLADLLEPDRGEISVPELLDFLRSPTVPLSEKIHLTDVVCEKLAIGKTVSDFLNVLIEKNRISLVGMIAREYDRIAGQMQSIQNVYVETARPLGEKQEEELRQAIEQATGATVRMDVRVRGRLLGGLLVRVGDTQLDGTLAGRLERLEKRLTS